MEVRVVRRVLTCFVLAFMPLLGSAFSEPIPPAIKFQRLLESKDFALGDVRGVLQDSRGFMWFGGSNGLMRYDGYEFKFVTKTIESNTQPVKQKESSLVQNVTDIFEDSEKTLWVVTTTQLLRYDARKETLTVVPNSPTAQPISNTNLRGALELPTGELLVPTWNGLFVVDRKTSQYSVILADSEKKSWLQSSFVNVAYLDKAGGLWLGTNAGLEKLDWKTKTFTLVKPYPQRPDLPDANQVFRIVADRDGSLWLGTPNGLVNYNPKAGSSTRYTNKPNDQGSFIGKPIEDLMLDKNGVLWIATDGGGLSIFEKAEKFPQGHFVTHKWQPDQNSSISTNVLRRIYEDRSGDIWIGNYPSGISYFDRSNEVLTTLFDDPKSRLLAHTPVLAVREDANHNLWFGSDGGGLSRLDRESKILTNYKNTPGNPGSLSGNAVLDVMIASDGKIWAGTWDGGVSILDPATGKFRRLPFDTARETTQSVTTSKRLNNDSVWSIKEDSQKNIWLGTFKGGLSKYDQKTETFTHYSYQKDDPDSISFGMVWNIFEDSIGNLWLGTLTGLDLLDRATGKFKHFRPNPKDPTSLSNASVSALFEDSKHRFWIGTEAGLNLMNADGKSFTVYNKSSGFNDDSIKTIVEDAEGQLWLSTNSGVTIFDPATRKVKNISRDGGRLMGIFHVDSGLLSSKGEVILGGVEGLRIFSPKKLKQNVIAPPMVFTGLKIFNEEVNVGSGAGLLVQSINDTESVVLDYKQNMLQLSFAALNFRESQRNQYAYKLEGFDENWLAVGDQRMAVYTNLDPGTYKFRVKGSNNDGIWNNDGAALTIIQRPPPWRTWWAYTIYALSLCIIVIMLTRSQRQKRREIEEQNRLLEIKVSERTLELANNNKTLELANKKLEEVSLSDPLTGLNNRRYLYKTLPQDIARSTRAYTSKSFELLNSECDLIVFLLDIDHFKSVNDIHGHNNGDRVLIQMADILKQVCRESDIIIRWGGEEFLIVARFTLRNRASYIAERIRQAVSQFIFELDNQKSLQVTCSIGYACFPFNTSIPEAINLEQTISIADHCLYKVKRNQRNGWLGLCQISGLNLPLEQLLKQTDALIKRGVVAIETSIEKELDWS